MLGGRAAGTCPAFLKAHIGTPARWVSAKMPPPEEPRPWTRAPCSFAWFTFGPHSGRSHRLANPARSFACPRWPPRFGSHLPWHRIQSHSGRDAPASPPSWPPWRLRRLDHALRVTAIYPAMSRTTTRPEVLRPVCTVCLSRSVAGSVTAIGNRWPGLAGSPASRLLRLGRLQLGVVPGSCPTHPCATLRPVP